MICPICQNNLGVDLPGIEEFYYDCSVCHSSLFFNQGKCEVISRGEWSAKSGAGDDKASEKKDIAGLRDEPYNINESDSEDLLQEIQQKNSDQNFIPTEIKSQMLEAKIERPSSQAMGGGTENVSSQAIGEGTRDLSSQAIGEGTRDLSSQAIGEGTRDLSSQAIGEGTRKLSSQTMGEGIRDLSSQATEEKVGLPEASAQESESFPAVDKKSDSSESEDFIQDEITEVPEIEDSPDELEYPEEEEESENNESSFVFSEEENKEENIKEDFSEVLEFSKRRDQDEKGLYLYQLSLSEINSQSLKETVRSVLEDKALGIDFEENSSYKKNIVYNGKVVLSRLSPVQVYVVIQSLMGLPLKIHWEQSHIVDS